MTVVRTSSKENFWKDFIGYLLAVGIANAESDDAVVADDDFPGSLGNAKPTRDGKIFDAIYVSDDRILPHRTGREVVKVTTFSTVALHPNRNDYFIVLFLWRIFVGDVQAC